jgi:hypothetical protein
MLDKLMMLSYAAFVIAWIAFCVHELWAVSRPMSAILAFGGVAIMLALAALWREIE